jgi:hypothetical protein
MKIVEVWSICSIFTGTIPITDAAKNAKSATVKERTGRGFCLLKLAIRNSITTSAHESHRVGVHTLKREGKVLTIRAEGKAFHKAIRGTNRVPNLNNYSDVTYPIISSKNIIPETPSALLAPNIFSI